MPCIRSLNNTSAYVFFFIPNFTFKNVRPLNSSAEMISSEVSASQEESPEGLPSQAFPSFDALKGSKFDSSHINKKNEDNSQIPCSCYIICAGNETTFLKVNNTGKPAQLSRLPQRLPVKH